MPTNLIENSAFDPNVAVPNPGEGITAADRKLTAQALANRTRYLKDHAWGTKDVSFRNVSLTTLLPNLFVATKQWFLVSSSGSKRGFWVQTDVTGAVSLMVDLDLPHGVTLTGILAVLEGDGGGATHSALPATLPTMILHIIDPNTAVPVTSETIIDPSANLGAYEAIHYLSLGVTHVVDQTFRYCVQITGETGANSVALALALYGLQVSWSAP